MFWEPGSVLIWPLLETESQSGYAKCDTNCIMTNYHFDIRTMKVRSRVEAEQRSKRRGCFILNMKPHSFRTLPSLNGLGSFYGFCTKIYTCKVLARVWYRFPFLLLQQNEARSCFNFKRSALCLSISVCNV